MRYYSEDHLWVDVDGNQAVAGLTAYAMDEIGEVNFVELPEVGRTMAKGDLLAVIESNKAAADVLSPVSGTVVRVNGALSEKPSLVNESPEKDGWICAFTLEADARPEGLLSEAEYRKFTE